VAATAYEAKKKRPHQIFCLYSCFGGTRPFGRILSLRVKIEKEIDFLFEIRKEKGADVTTDAQLITACEESERGR
jgi:hypothetical protein